MLIAFTTGLFSSLKRWKVAILFAVLCATLAFRLYHLSPFASVNYLNNQSQGSSSSIGNKNLPPIVFYGNRNKQKVALTFDADMTPGMKDALLNKRVKTWYNKEAIAVLNQTHTKATLFLTGMWIELYPNETKKLAANPLFELGNHSYSHPSFNGVCYGLQLVSQSEKLREVERTQQLLKDVAGVENHLFRFPGGCSSPDDINMVNNAGLTVVEWDVVGGDGFNNNPVIIESNILKRVQNGSIIVLHMNGTPNSPRTAEVLLSIIPTLKNRGYEFVTVSQLLRGETEQIGQARQDLDTNRSL